MMDSNSPPLRKLISLLGAFGLLAGCGGPPSPAVQGYVEGEFVYVSSPQAEYTPPVIYSRESRGKLVFMVEAVFDAPTAATLHPGYIQISLLLLAARFIFDVPMIGSLALLFAVALIFIAANLSMGITFSTIAQNQRQAIQMGVFFFLPSILLSGFMFPFRGMPRWAQAVGETLPLTHFLRVVRGILLKGNGLAEIVPQLWPIALFTAVVLAIGLKRCRQTLD
jgi:ABC-type polysaccharide/polyol phosphate export permease